MSCLTQKQLANLALGGSAEPDQSAHLKRCEACQEGLESMRSLVQQLARPIRSSIEGTRRPDRGSSRTSCGRSGRGPVRPSTNPFFPDGRTDDETETRLRRCGGDDAGGTVRGLDCNRSQPGLRDGQVAETIRQAKSYEYTMTTEMSMAGGPARRRWKADMKGKFSWLAPGSYRMETKGSDAMAGLDSLMILPAGKPGIEIDRKAKKYTRQPARLGQISPLMMVEKLSQFSGQADRLLGTKEIDGKAAKGFEIQARKIDPDIYSGPIEIWIDAQTNLPVLIRYEMTTSGVPAIIKMAEFRWNVDLDPKLFDPAQPEGYTENVRPATPIDDQVHKITEGLKLYAKYSGGHYPRVKMLYGDVTRDEFVKLSGVPYPPQKEKDFADPRVKEVNDATWGFATINTILRENADAAYHGKTVGPDDKDKVLFRWKLDDGSYKVIFGDLKSETVAPGRLRVLEGP